MKLSVPSYVVPGTWLENLRWLEANTRQRRVELLFFMYDDDAKSILARELPAIRDYADSFSYTVHLPDGLGIHHRELIESVSSWVGDFVVHPPRQEDDIDKFCRMLDELRAGHGPERFLLENTESFLFERAEAALSSSAFGPPPLCADVGHLAMQGIAPAPWVAARHERIRELHLHGFDGHRDHAGFIGSEPWLRSLEPFFANFNGVAELELFSWHELQPAIAALRHYDGRAIKENA